MLGNATYASAPPTVPAWDVDSLFGSLDGMHEAKGG